MGNEGVDTCVRLATRDEKNRLGLEGHLLNAYLYEKALWTFQVPH